MKTNLTSRSKTETGSALFVVLGIMVIAFMLLGSALSWSSSTSANVYRNNQYFRTVAAAEAATEKVLTRIASDFQSANGETTVYNNLSNDRNLVPTSAENSYWGSFQFSDGQGNNNRTFVNRLSPTTWTNLNSQYTGLYGQAATYQISSYARDTAGRYAISTGVQQNMQVATIPVFQFAIFYNVDLEIEPSPNMTVNGRVHGNNDIYLNPANGLTFQSHVTASGNLITGIVAGDPNHSGLQGGTTTYNGEHDDKASQLTLPVGTSNTPDDVYKILQPPPVGESASSALGQQRYYNKADVIVTVAANGVITATGPSGVFALPAGTVTGSTNKFYNGREGKGVNVIDVDVSKFKTWSNSHTTSGIGGQQPSTIYVNDLRTAPSGTENGVRLINGSQLPNAGLTVATPDPLYVQGDFNIKDSSGTSSGSSTDHTKPSSLVADAISVLSNNWTDSDNATSSKGNNHDATSTTVNTAFLSGIVPTDTSSYSGGVENFPRFLENWGGDTLTYNGSMVVMFFSKVATGKWSNGTSYYSPPTRNWAFDLNFLDATKLPPGTPKFQAVIRGDWLTLGKNPAG